MTYTHTVRVVGNVGVRFPIDMLRYDNCYPRTAHDAELIQTAGDVHNRKGFMVVWLSKTSTDREPRWTEGRWQSFGWRVHRESMCTLRKT